MRDYKFDNIKACLILLVVFGHFLEIVPGHRFLYLFIYAFHMPVFLFLSGYFAKFDRKKLVFGLILPYFIFQTLYRCFDAWVIKSTKVELIYTKPWWITWYLMTLIVYYFLISLIDVEKNTYRAIIFAASIMISLLSGFDTSVGYAMSLARTASFLPYFVAGFYLRKTGENRQPKTGIKWGFAIAVVSVTAFVLSTGEISKKMLYGSYSYEAADYSVGIKAMLMLIAFAWIVVWLWIVPKKYVPVLSKIGRYTMPVFLLHGFIVKLIGKWVSMGLIKLNIGEAMVATVIIVMLLGNQYSNDLFCNIFTLRWLWNRKKHTLR